MRIARAGYKPIMLACLHAHNEFGNLLVTSLYNVWQVHSWCCGRVLKMEPVIIRKIHVSIMRLVQNWKYIQRWRVTEDKPLKLERRRDSGTWDDGKIVSQRTARDLYDQIMNRLCNRRVFASCPASCTLNPGATQIYDMKIIPFIQPAHLSQKYGNFLRERRIDKAHIYLNCAIHCHKRA